MSNDDYRMGQQGLRYDRTMDKADYDRGKADREDQAAAAAGGGGSMSAGSGAGIGLIFLIPVFAIMYPTVTMSQAVMIGALWLATKWMPPSLYWLRVVISIAGIVGAFYLAFKAEGRASRSKIYRNVRHVFRTVVIGLVTFAFMIDLGHSRDFQTALDHAPPNSLFAALVAMGLMLWLGPKFDRFFMDVRDAHAIAQEKKFGGKSSIEIDEIKHAETRSRLKFFGVWLVGTIALMVALPHSPVALSALGMFGVCWFGRKMLFSGRKAAGT